MDTAMLGVKEFTEGSMGVELPSKPKIIDFESAKVLSKFVMEEIFEFLWASHILPNEDTNIDQKEKELLAKYIKSHMQGILDSKIKERTDLRIGTNEKEIISDQGDALVDMIYYIMNCAAKNGINLAKIFDKVQEANMNKGILEPETGKRKFIIRESDRKVMKPEGWKEPDIDAVVDEMLENGSWA